MFRKMTTADKWRNERMEKSDERKPAGWTGENLEIRPESSITVAIDGNPVASRQVSSQWHPKTCRRHIILRGGPQTRLRCIYTNEK